MSVRFTRTQFIGFVTVAVICMIIASCNRRSPLPSEGGSISPSPTPTPSPMALFGISLAPPGMFGSAPGTGIAILTRPAPPGGIVVALSSGDPSVAMVPPFVAIPEGADRAAFPIATQTVSADRQVPITGSATGTSASAPLAVWAVLPTFLSWFSDPGDSIGRGGFGRLTPASATFATAAGDAAVTIGVNGAGGDSWSLQFTPVRNGRLQIGPYEDAMRFNDATHPGLSISGRALACNSSGGRFEIRELIMTPIVPATNTRLLLLFDATFEQHCNNAAPALRGEVRFTAGAP